MGTRGSSGLSGRVEATTPTACRGPARRRRGGGPRRSLRGAPPTGPQRLPGDDTVVEGVAHALDLLVGFVSLAGNDDDIARGRSSDGAVNRGSAGGVHLQPPPPGPGRGPASL